MLSTTISTPTCSYFGKTMHFKIVAITFLIGADEKNVLYYRIFLEASLVLLRRYNDERRSSSSSGLRSSTLQGIGGTKDTLRQLHNLGTHFMHSIPTIHTRIKWKKTFRSGLVSAAQNALRPCAISISLCY